MIISGADISDTLSYGIKLDSHCDVTLSKSRFNRSVTALHYNRDVRYTEGVINIVWISDVNVTSSSCVGFHLRPRDTEVTIQKCEFTKNLKQPLYIDSYHTQDTAVHVRVEGCRFHDNEGYYNGIDISEKSDFPFVVEVSDTEISGSKYGIGVQCYSGKVTKESNFTQVSYKGVLCYSGKVTKESNVTQVKLQRSPMLLR